MSSDALWLGSELSALWGVAVADDLACRDIALDSRTVEPGALFFALKGNDPRFRGAKSGGRDGQDFAQAALERGAAAVVVRRSLGAGAREIVVADPFDALWQLAAAARNRCAGPVFALTGSSGKTTAKALLTAALTAHFGAGAVHSAEGSLNNHLGVPLSLARLPRRAAAAVFELGMNQPGEIAPLSRLVQPTVALVLNILPVHLEGLGSLEAIAQEKLSIAEGLLPGGCLVCPDGRAPRAITTLSFRDRRGAAPEAPATTFWRKEDGSLTTPEGTLSLQALGAEHRQRSAAAVLACLSAAGLPIAGAIRAMAAVPSPPGRGSRLSVAGRSLIDESYNANPESVALALRDLAAAPGPRFALLADMLELGPEGPAFHQGLLPGLAALDGVFLVGPLMSALAAPLGPRCLGAWPTLAELELEPILRVLTPGAQLLIKGSNRFFWQGKTVDALRQRLEAMAY